MASKHPEDRKAEGDHGEDEIDKKPTRKPRKPVGRIVIVMIGQTGCGKSSMGNLLLGKSVTDGPFRVSAAVDAGTNEVSVIDGNFLGIEGRRIRVVDTPGFADPEGRDELFRIQLVEQLRQLRKIHVILWVRNAQNARIDVHETEYIKIMAELFGTCVLENSVLNFTHFAFDERSVEKRRRDGRSLESLAEGFWNLMLSSEISNEAQDSSDELQEFKQIPFCAVDALCDPRDEVELDAFDIQARMMWKAFKRNYRRPVRELQYLYGRLDEILKRYQAYKDSLIKKEQELEKLRTELAKLKNDTGFLNNSEREFEKLRDELAKLKNSEQPAPLKTSPGTSPEAATKPLFAQTAEASNPPAPKTPQPAPRTGRPAKAPTEQQQQKPATEELTEAETTSKIGGLFPTRPAPQAPRAGINAQTVSQPTKSPESKPPRRNIPSNLSAGDATAKTEQQSDEKPPDSDYGLRPEIVQEYFTKLEKAQREHQQIVEECEDLKEEVDELEENKVRLEASKKSGFSTRIMRWFVL